MSPWEPGSIELELLLSHCVRKDFKAHQDFYSKVSADLLTRMLRVLHAPGSFGGYASRFARASLASGLPIRVSSGTRTGVPRTLLQRRRLEP